MLIEFCRTDQSGSAPAEYALLVAGVAGAVASAVALLGSRVSDLFASILRLF